MTLTGGQVAQRNVLGNIVRAKRAVAVPHTYKYTDVELVLYALSVGAKQTDLDLVFEAAKSSKHCPALV